MAKRRRRIKIKNSKLFAALTILLSLLLFATSAANSHHNHHVNHHHSNHHNQQHQSATRHHLQQAQTLDFAPPATSAPTSTSQLIQLQQQQQQHQHQPLTSTLHLCSQLPQHTARQLKLCKLMGHSASVDEALAGGITKGLAECRNQFKNERWNCTHSIGGDHSLLTSELAQSVGNRESGFVNAITAAGIVHAIATACSVGSLRDCACDKTRVGLIRRHEDSRIGWGGCSNNIRHGMVYAKHLIELLDAYHQQSRQQQTATKSHPPTTRHHNPHHSHHHRGKRALSRRDNFDPNQVQRATSQTTTNTTAAASPSNEQQQFAFCSQKNHNISHTAHSKLIKSLLAKNSLERHQEFRLAMNMHNNKIGRMAVAKNMELRCRCHGLSGSCSLKTCWQTLPDFQLIGAYLRKKYEASVHLPSVVDVNKLILMMDRAEISSILNGGGGQDAQQQQQQSPAALASTSSTSDFASGMLDISTASGNEHDAAPNANQPQQDAPALPEYAPLVAAPPSPNGRIQLSGHFIVDRPPTTTTTTAPGHQPMLELSAYTSLNSATNYASYYDSFKQRIATTTTTTNTPDAPSSTSSTIETPSTSYPTYEAQTTGDQFQEIPAYNITPMTQQQYQALIRDMKLCNNNSTLATTNHHLTVREMAQPDVKQSRLGAAGNSKKTASIAAHNQQTLQQQHNGGVKNANYQLSHLLQHSNKDELIHLHKSPNYCEADLRHGFAGIQSRQCSENPSDPDNCDKLCCGRGYTKHIYRQKYDCDCKFQYCCSIWCSVCEREIKVVLCK